MSGKPGIKLSKETYHALYGMIHKFDKHIGRNTMAWVALLSPWQAGNG
jgi:hypothetical protein